MVKDKGILDLIESGELGFDPMADEIAYENLRTWAANHAANDNKRIAVRRV